MYLNDLMKRSEAEGKEKHLPHIDIKPCNTCGELAVTVRVGKEIFHPSTKEHFIEHIALHALTKDDSLVFITRFELGRESTVPYVKTHIKKGMFKKLFAVSLCNVHGLWESSVDIND